MTAPATIAEPSSADELRALAESVAEFFAAQGGTAAVRAVMDSGIYDAGVWQQMCSQLGLAGLAASEPNGGAGAGFRELAVVLEAAGRALYPSPLLPTSLAVWSLDTGGESAATTRWLTPLVSGAGRAAVVAGPGARGLSIAGEHLSGVVPGVLDAAAADVLVVAAPDGLALVERTATGVVVADRPGIDGTRPLADVSFDAVAIELIGGAAASARLAAAAAVGVACEQVGGAAAALDAAVSYAKLRTQFGAPIGSFQAIKHMCADVLLAVEAGRSATRQAARAIDAADPELEVVASIAKAWCSDAYVNAAETSLQIHGGIGFTWEHDAHLHLKRAKTDEFLFGDARYHRERLAELLGLQRSSS